MQPFNTSSTTSQQSEYMPTPDEIRAACLEIQKEWTEEERMRRRRIATETNSMPDEE